MKLQGPDHKGPQVPSDRARDFIWRGKGDTAGFYAEYANFAFTFQ
jgi:hypothetical protein